MIFLFFSSSLAHLEPKLDLFEVLEFRSWCHWRWWWFVARLSPKLQTALARVLDKLERNQKKEKIIYMQFFRKKCCLESFAELGVPPPLLQKNLQNSIWWAPQSLSGQNFKTYGLNNRGENPRNTTSSITGKVAYMLLIICSCFASSDVGDPLLCNSDELVLHQNNHLINPPNA